MASFTPQPLSAAEFNSLGANTGAGTAADSLKSLGDTIAQGPMRAAQGQYYGAQTGHLQVQTRQAQQSLEDGQRIQELIGPQPDGSFGIANGPNLQKVGALMARNPDLAARFGSTLAAMFAARAAQSGAPPDAGAQADQLSARLGVTPMGNTPSGQGLGLASAERQTGMTAGATVQSARIGADAELQRQGMVTGEARRQFDKAPTNVTGPGGPTIVTQDSAPGNKPYSPVADASNQTITPGFGPNGPTYGRPGDAGFTPPVPSDSVLGNLMAQGGTGAGGISGNGPVNLPPPAATPTPGAQAAATIPAGTPQGPGGVPSTGNPIADAALRAKTGMPQTVAPPATDDPAAGTKLDAAVMDSLQKNFITPAMTRGLGQVDAGALAVTPEARAAILARVNQLTHSRDPLLQNNTNSAVEQAIQELKPRLTFDHGNGPSSYLPGSSAGPTIGLAPDPGAAPSALATTLAGGGAPGQAPPTQTPPAPGPSPVASALAGPPPAPAPAAPGPRTPSAVKPSTTEAPAPRPGPGAQAAPPAQGDASGAPPPRALAALKEGVPTTFANGQTWTLKNGQPTRIK